jgi:hypothetical protein
MNLSSKKQQIERQRKQLEGETMKRLLTTLAGIGLSLGVGAAGAEARVDNFTLLDHAGEAHELYYHSDAKAVVLLTHAASCPSSLASVKSIQSLQARYGDDVRFYMLNSNLGDDRAALAKEAKEMATNIPILVDDTQLVGESLDIQRSGETIVIDPATWNVRYRGPAARSDQLASAIDATLAGTTFEYQAEASQGCEVEMPYRDHSELTVTYADDIGPLLRDNCVTCHRPGGMGPFAMTDYNMVRGFSLMIREVIRTKRMPPWHADPHYGEWANDRSLTVQERQDLVHWIEAGAPRGEGDDPLLADDRVWPEWRLGEPDMVINIPATEVPATGVVDYQYLLVENPFEEDVWIAATEYLPGDLQALHHVVSSIGYVNPDPEAKQKFMPISGMGGYAPGSDTGRLPDGSGIFLPAKAKFMFQMHYTSYGKATVDETKVGLWLHKSKPKYTMKGKFVMNTDIRIPPNTKRHTETKTWTLEEDVLMYSMMPHSHFRGIASDFKVIYPDGREDMVLSVPNYDFNWQTDYYFETPLVLPAGTKIVHSTTWDNSSQNPANPDPSIEVTWGEQSWEEMLFALLQYRILEEGEREGLMAASAGGR